MVQLKDTNFYYAGKGTSGCIEKIELEIKCGECIILCGRSGCGKTTITRLINKLIPGFFAGEFKGEVRVDGEDTFDMPMHKLSKKVGSVFQNPKTQFFNTDTDSEIVFGCENCAMPQEELEKRRLQAITDLKLEELSSRNIFELSGGEKQKIAFASVYAMNPDVYLLDEPSSNLDVESVYALRDYLKWIKQQGKTIIVAEHRLYYLMGLADRVVYIEDGKIQEIWGERKLSEMQASKRSDLGLRAINMNQVHVNKRSARDFDNDTEKIFEARNVSVFRKKNKLLEDITFQAKRGEIIAITGINGCGKTTFLRTICGLHSEYKGQFLWNGEEVKEKQRLSYSYMVMQDVNYQLFGDSLETECQLGVKANKSQIIEETLKRLQLYELRKRHPNTLSGGQKQRLAIAVSVVNEKDILLLDEPTSGLDYDSMDMVAATLVKLCNNRIIFVVTHDYEFICKACTRVLHFEKGKLMADVPVDAEHEKVIQNYMGVRNYE